MDNDRGEEWARRRRPKRGREAQTRAYREAFVRHNELCFNRSGITKF